MSIWHGMKKIPRWCVSYVGPTSHVPPVRVHTRSGILRAGKSIIRREALRGSSPPLLLLLFLLLIVVVVLRATWCQPRTSAGRRGRRERGRERATLARMNGANTWRHKRKMSKNEGEDEGGGAEQSRGRELRSAQNESGGRGRGRSANRRRFR